MCLHCFANADVAGRGHVKYDVVPVDPVISDCLLESVASVVAFPKEKLYYNFLEHKLLKIF